MNKNKEKSTKEMKTIKIPIRKYRDNALSQPQNAFNHFPTHRIPAGIRKCGAMLNAKFKCVPKMISRCAPHKRRKNSSEKQFSK